MLTRDEDGLVDLGWDADDSPVPALLISELLGLAGALPEGTPL